MSTDFLFRIWPYAAVAIWGAGMVVRYLRALPRMDAVADDLQESWSAFGSGKLLRMALGFLALAHVVALVSPGTILAWNGSPDRLYILEGVGFVVGGFALLGWLRLLAKHLQTRHPSALVDVGDTLFSSMILVGLVSGLATAAVHRWASSWSVATLTPYVMSLLAGKPVTAYAAELPWTIQLHVCAGFAALAAFPFTRLAPFLVIAIHRVFLVAGRPAAALGKGAEGWFRRHNPGVWIWPKED